MPYRNADAIVIYDLLKLKPHKGDVGVRYRLERQAWAWPFAH